MPIGELKMQYVLCKMCKIKVKKDCLLETKNTQNHEKWRLGKTQAILLKFWYRIFPVSPSKYK